MKLEATGRESWVSVPDNIKILGKSMNLVRENIENSIQFKIFFGFHLNK